MKRFWAGLIFLFSLWAAAPETPKLSTERVLLETSRGDLILALYPEVAPKTVAQFLTLVRKGVYDHTGITYVDPGYYIQVGTSAERAEPLSSEQRAAIHPLPNEFSDLTHRSGVLSISLLEDRPNSAETAFTIMRGVAPQMDGKATIFGEVEDGDDVLRTLESVPRNSDLQPVERLEIVRAEVLASAEAYAQAKQATELSRSHTQLQFSALTFLGIALTGLFSFFLKTKVTPRTLAALNLTATLLAAFALFVLLTPMTRETPILGGLVFLGMIGFYKLMNRFESI